MVYYNLALVLQNQGCPDEAEKYYRKAIASDIDQVDPKYNIVYYNLGSLLKSQGRIEESEEFYKKAMK